MDMRNIKEWLDPYKPEKNLRIGDKFTVPNTVIMIVGEMDSWREVYTEANANIYATRIEEILTGKGFQFLFFNENLGPVTAAQILSFKQDTFGLVAFAHGLGPQDDSRGGGIEISETNAEILRPVDYPNNWFGLLALKTCYAKEAGWGKTVSANGVSWLGSGREFVTGPGMWGFMSTIEKAH